MSKVLPAYRGTRATKASSRPLRRDNTLYQNSLLSPTISAAKSHADVS